MSSAITVFFLNSGKSGYFAEVTQSESSGTLDTTACFTPKSTLLRRSLLRCGCRYVPEPSVHTTMGSMVDSLDGRSIVQTIMYAVLPTTRYPVKYPITKPRYQIGEMPVETDPEAPRTISAATAARIVTVNAS